MEVTKEAGKKISLLANPVIHALTPIFEAGHRKEINHTNPKRRELAGYTLEELHSLPNPYIGSILENADILIDGPFIKELSENASEWCGSTNQRIIYKPANPTDNRCAE